MERHHLYLMHTVSTKNLRRCFAMEADDVSFKLNSTDDDVSVTSSFYFLFKPNTDKFSPPRVLEMVLIAGEAEPTPSASLKKKIIELFRRNIKKDFHDLLNYFAWKRNPNEIGQQDWNIWNGENSSEQEGTLFLKETFKWNKIKWEPSIYFEGTGLVGLHNGGDDGGSDLDNTNTNAKTEFRIQGTKYEQRDGLVVCKMGVMRGCSGF